MASSLEGAVSEHPLLSLLTSGPVCFLLPLPGMFCPLFLISLIVTHPPSPARTVLVRDEKLDPKRLKQKQKLLVLKRKRQV